VSGSQLGGVNAQAKSYRRKISKKDKAEEMQERALTLLTCDTTYHAV